MVFNTAGNDSNKYPQHQRGDSNTYPQPMFLRQENKANHLPPLKLPYFGFFVAPNSFNDRLR